MPQNNTSVTFNIDGDGIVGSLTFQLFNNLTPTIAEQIETLVTDGLYNGDYIYRSDAGFVVQGGNILPTISNGSVSGQTQVNKFSGSSSGTVPTVDDEFNPDLTYTSSGSLGLAIPSPNNGSSEFFIGKGTSTARQPLNFSYSLFGFLTVDQAITVNGQATTVLAALEADSTSADTASGSGGDLLSPIQITSATLSTDSQNGVLMLRRLDRVGHLYGDRDGIRRHQHARYPDVPGERRGQLDRVDRQPLDLPDANRADIDRLPAGVRPGIEHGHVGQQFVDLQGTAIPRFRRQDRRPGDGLRQRRCHRLGQRHVNFAVGFHRRHDGPFGRHAHHHRHGDAPECIGNLDRYPEEQPHRYGQCGQLEFAGHPGQG